MPTKVYRFGLLPPVTNQSKVRELMFTGHKYRNTLTEIERERRKAVREAIGPAIVDSEQLAAKLGSNVQTIAKEIKALHAKEKTLKTPKELATQLKDARHVHKTAINAFHEAKKRVYEDPEMKARIAAIEEHAAEKRRMARGDSGLARKGMSSFGTYQRVEAACDQSRKMPLYDGTAHNDPAFKRFTDATPSFAVHLQNEYVLPAEKLFQSNDWVWIDPVDERVWFQETRRGDRRKLSRTKLHIRLGAPDGVPMMTEFPMVMHRAIPAGGKISWVVVQVTRHGPREEWSVCFTVTFPETSVAPSALRGTGAVAIDLGWRVIPETGELRVASWYGEDGQQGELRLNRYALHGLEIPDQLHSLRDQKFNVARDSLTKWIVGKTDLPTWLVQEIPNLAQWRSPNRLASVARKWRNNRFPGDEEAYAELEAWRYRDYHLWCYETGQRSGALRHRREIYRIFGATLAKNYDTVVFEDFDLRKIARRPSIKEKNENETARTNRVRAATSELRLWVLNAFSSRGGSNSKVDAVDSTHICRVCGSVESFDAAAFITHVCSGCGTFWDQDENSAKVLFERFRTAQSTGTSRGTVIVNESKWKRLKREKFARVRGSEGKADRDATRESIGNPSEGDTF